MNYHFDKSGKIMPPSAEELAVADAEVDIIVLDTGTFEDGTPYWAYVGIKPSKYSTFMGMTSQQKLIAFEDYGTILKHGFEKEVPAHIKEEMKNNHNFDEHYIERLRKDIIDTQTVFLKQQEAKRINDIVSMLKNKQG
jgi:hypothetical protein